MSISQDNFSDPNRLKPTESLSASSQYPSNAFQMNLISQYLTFNGCKNQKQSELAQLPKQNTANKDLSSIQQCEIKKAQQAESQPKGKSSFHNFQKHLINTLKNNIKLKKIQSIERSKLRLAYSLWEHFTSSVKSTKKLLYTILGDNFINNQQFKQPSNSQRSDLFQLINKSTEEELHCCQIYLRNVIVKQSKNLLKGKLLKGRRIHRSQEFKSYFQNFVKQMEEGMIMRRMPKEKKKSIMQNSSIEENI